MKKRLLALCLAAALLVGIAPALSLSTGVSAAKADVVVQDKLIDKANEITINNTSYNDSATAHAPNGSGIGLYMRTTSTTTGWAEYQDLDIDHTKTVEWFTQIQFNVFNDKGDVVPHYVSESGAISRGNCWSMILNDSDAENGGFVLPYMYSSNQKLYIQFLMPGSTYGNDIYSDAIDLGATYSTTNGGKFDSRYELKLVWLPNGDVEVWFNTSTFSGGFIWAGWEKKATVKSATWTHGTASEPNIYGQEISAEDTDFILHGLHYDTDQSVYIWDTSVTSYSTFAEALLTGEDIAVDNALNELSWRYASWTSLVGDVEGEAAVLMKNGEAYVALKSATATSATVTLGDNTKENVSFVNGVAEIKFVDASIDSLKENLAYSVIVTDGEKVGALEYTTVALNSKKVNTDLKGQGNFVETRWSADQTEVKEGAIYRNGIDFVSSDADLMNNQRIGFGKYFAFTSGCGAAKWNHQNDIYAEFQLYTDDIPVAANEGKFGADGTCEGFWFHLLDRENNAIILANIYNADAEGNLKARVLKSDKTNSDPIDLGIKVGDEIGAARFGFLWTKEGAVIVLVNGEVKGVVENATIAAANPVDWSWTSPDNADRMLAQLATPSGRMYIYEFAVREVSMDPNEVVTQQVALGDDLNFSFNANVGKTGTASATVNGQTIEADANGKISINLAAAQMNDVVELTITDECGITSVKEYTIRDYALAILNNAEYADAHELVEAMLHYGAAAQTYFEHNDNALVTEGLNLTAPTAAPEADAAANITDGGLADLGIKYYGASLLFKNKTTLRFYFQVEGDIAAAAFYVGGPNGTPVTPKRAGENSNFYYIDVVDIKPQDLDDQVTIFAADVEFGGMLSTSITYSPANYMVNIYNSTDSAALKQLMVAMYNYSLYANEYLA